MMFSHRFGKLSCREIVASSKYSHEMPQKPIIR